MKKRIAMIYAENDIIGDGLFTPELAEALREYAGMIELGLAGNVTCEVHESKNGTKLTITGASWDGGLLPSKRNITQQKSLSERAKKEFGIY
ncbi:hypothetical protein [Budvicia aquatica]|uniref:hypothetical protein n=1 Tax=Budvicia aquatica TaxID=82979 RepID=UPI002082F021|nr:hypothetical protein [Budvicia aquatica]GKX50629.1 hypothetical protein SOASR029_09380 [Budvicia aquatica]